MYPLESHAPCSPAPTSRSPLPSWTPPMSGFVGFVCLLNVPGNLRQPDWTQPPEFTSCEHRSNRPKRRPSERVRGMVSSDPYPANPNMMCAPQTPYPSMMIFVPSSQHLPEDRQKERVRHHVAQVLRKYGQKEGTEGRQERPQHDQERRLRRTLILLFRFLFTFLFLNSRLDTYQEITAFSSFVSWFRALGGSTSTSSTSRSSLLASSSNNSSTSFASFSSSSLFSSRAC